jgi:hypothetical protein
MHHGNQIQECKVVDAFSFLWTDNFYYALPPFSLSENPGFHLKYFECN